MHKNLVQTLCAAFCAILAHLSMGGGGMNIAAHHSMIGGNKIPTAKDYVQDGLIAMWDGIENAGFGVHDASATMWKDLCGSNDLSNPHASAWDSDGYVFDATYSFYSTTANINPLISNAWTAECIYRIDAAMNNYQCVFGSRMSGVYGIYGLNMWGMYQCGSGNNSSNNDAFDTSKTAQLIPLTVKDSVHSMTLGFSGGNSYFLGDSGVIVATSTSSRTPGAALGYMIGRGWCQNTSSLANADGSRVFKGKVFTHRIYSRALTAAEIAANYAVDKARFNLP